METKTMQKRNDKSDIQSSFLASVRGRIPFNLSFPDELAELLNISLDSAYRRIRKETIMNLDEVRILCDRYNISIDSLMFQNSGNVSFELKAQNGSGIPFQSWLESILVNLETLASVPGADLVWHSKELPIFHYFQVPRLAAFKLFIWMKLSTGENLCNGKYDERSVGQNLIALGEKIWDKYSHIPSTEIISRELINTTLRQIQYGLEGEIIDKTQAAALCQDCSYLIDQFKLHTEQGLKGQEAPGDPRGKFDVYLNELMIGDNTIVARMGDKRITYMMHNNFNMMSTGNHSFCEMTEQFMNSMISKSVLISRVSAKERSRFFNHIYKQIDEVKSGNG
jgi:hypothetical protein